MIVQEADPADAIVAGEQVSADKDVVCEIETTPPAVLSGTIHDSGALPRADSDTVDEVLLELLETVSVKVAMDPSPITFWLTPDSTHEYCPALMPAHCTVLEAALPDVPTETLILLKSCVEYATCHPTDATCAPAAERVTGNETVFPRVVEPFPNESEAP
jgi:hypothetical protein